MVGKFGIILRRRYRIALRGLAFTVVGVGGALHFIILGNVSAAVLFLLFALIGIILLLFLVLTSRGQGLVKSSAELSQEFNPFNNIIHSLQKETQAEAQQLTSRADEIKKLAELKDKGVHTEKSQEMKRRRKILQKLGALVGVLAAVVSAWPVRRAILALLREGDVLYAVLVLSTLVVVTVSLYWLSQKKKKETLAEAQQLMPSIADEIKKLSELKDKGIITEEEFQEMKRKLLEKY